MSVNEIISRTNIQWFPGHMAKALRDMAEEIKKVDMVIYVLDARAPKSSVNPEFIGIIGEKPILYVLNKADMVESSDLLTFVNYFKKDNTEILALDSTKSGAIKQIEPLMTKLCKEKLNKYSQKGFKMNLRAMVIGVPNSGKSTLINNLCGVKKTITGDKAGVTRGKQWLSLKNGFEVLDTPGTLYPKISNQQIALNLAFIGSVRNEVVDMNELCVDFLNFCKKYYYQNIKEKYLLSSYNLTALEIIEEVAKFKHYLLKGGELDYDRTCFSIIDDFRKGKLGKIVLDK
ncbi:MAG: ribosome biogenesis GTPase YlqF [Clostridiales bacterium]|nr:ribosome biogenesis GTPase YlqF [Clostridiales bacterium]